MHWRDAVLCVSCFVGRGRYWINKSVCVHQRGSRWHLKCLKPQRVCAKQRRPYMLSRCACVPVCISTVYQLSELMSMCVYVCIFSLNGTSALNWPLNATRCASGFVSYKCRKTKRARQLQSGWVTFQAFHLQSTICFCSSSLSIIIYIFSKGLQLSENIVQNLRAIS